MSRIKRQSLKATIYTYLGVALGFFTTALLFPKYLSTSQIGVLSLIVSYSLVLTQFGTLGLGGAIPRYLPLFRDKASGHKGFLSLILLVSLLGSLLSIGLFYLIKPHLLASNVESSPLFVEYINLIIPLTVFGIFFGVLDVYNTSLFVATTGTLLKDVFQRFLFIVFFLFLVFNFIDFDLYVYLYTFAICSLTILLIAFLFYRGEFKVNLDLSKFNRSVFAAIGGYSFFSWINGFSTLAVTRLDIIMLNEYYDASIAGIYSITFYFASLIILPSRVFGKTSSIYLSEAFHQNDIETIKKIHLRVSLNQWIVGLYVMLGLVCNLHNIFKLLPAEYESGLWVIVLIGFSNLVRMIGGMDNAIIDFSKEYKVLSLFLVLFLIAQLVFNFILIPPYQMVGAALASLLAVIVFTVIKASYIYKKLKITSFSKGHWISMIIGLTVYAILYYIPSFDNLYIDSCFRGLIITVAFGLPIILLKISEDINQMLQKIVSLLIKNN